jgi:uncharacterized membrane protein YqiK
MVHAVLWVAVVLAAWLVVGVLLAVFLGRAVAIRDRRSRVVEHTPDFPTQPLPVVADWPVAADDAEQEPQRTSRATG